MIDGRHTPELARLGRALMGEPTVEPLPAGLRDMTREIDGRLAEIEQVLDGLTRQGILASDPRLAGLATGADSLRALRDRIENGGADTSPALLRAQLAEAIRLTEGLTQGGAAGAVTSGDGRMIRVVAEAEYRASMTRIERDMDLLMQSSETAFRDTLREAAAYGIDTEGHEAASDYLRERAERRRQQGDRIGAVTDEYLALSVEADLAADLAEETGQPEHVAAAEEAEQRKQQGRLLVEQAITAQARREAAERGLVGAEADAFVGQTVERQMAYVDQQETELRGALDRNLPAHEIIYAIETGADIPLTAPHAAEAAEVMRAEREAVAADVGAQERVSAADFRNLALPETGSVPAMPVLAMAEPALPWMPDAPPVDVAEAAPPPPSPVSPAGTGGRTPV